MGISWRWRLDQGRLAGAVEGLAWGVVASEYTCLNAFPVRVGEDWHRPFRR